MTAAKRLRMGVDCPAATPEEEKRRIEVLHATVKKHLPAFVRSVAELERHKNRKDCTLFLHQDAFAAGYDDDEFTLFGMAVKYAGLHGVTVTITGTNHETF